MSTKLHIVLGEATKWVIYCSVLIGRQATVAFYDALMFGNIPSAIGCVVMLIISHLANLISYDDSAPSSPAWLTVAAAMLSLFIVVPCWGQARLPRPWYSFLFLSQCHSLTHINVSNLLA
jgi:hypothetical protein